MKYDRKKLLRSLDLIRPGVAGRETVEQSDSFVFLKDRIVSFNDEIAVVTPFETGITAAVEAKKFMAYLNRMPDDEISIKLTGNELRVGGKRRNSGFPIQTEIMLPVSEIEEPPDSWRILPDNFLSILDFVSASCSKKQNEPVANSVHIRRNVAEATDRYRLTRVTFSRRVVANPILIPANTIRRLASYEVNEWAWGEWVHFRNDEGTVYSVRRLAEDFPNVDTVLNKITRDVPIRFPKEIIDILHRSALFDSIHGMVTLTFEPHRLIVRAESESDGWFEEVTPANYNGPELTFSVVNRVLTEIMKRDNIAYYCDGVLFFEGTDPQFVHCMATSNVK